MVLLGKQNNDDTKFLSGVSTASSKGVGLKLLVKIVCFCFFKNKDLLSHINCMHID